MGRLAISLFGGVCLRVDGRPVGHHLSDKGRALIAYLAVESTRPHRRSTLADLLWPCQPEPAARTNLRQTIHRLIHALGQASIDPPFLLVTYQDIQLNLHSSCWIDVTAFSRLLAPCPEHHLAGAFLCQSCLNTHRAAVELYQGDFLTGLSLSGCPDFEWWLTCRQEMYHRQVIEALKSLVYHYELEQRYAQAIEYAQRAIELEPWSESLHRRKMSLFAQNNQPNAALRQYEQCRQILAKELGVEPAVETTTLFHQIRASR